MINGGVGEDANAFHGIEMTPLVHLTLVAFMLVSCTRLPVSRMNTDTATVNTWQLSLLTP